MFAQLASLLFYSREYAHRAHLVASKHSTHVVLDEFYKALDALADRLIETYQGRHGFVQFETLSAEDPLDNPAATLSQHLQIIESLKLGDRALMAIQDEISGLYLRTLYKLNLE